MSFAINIVNFSTFSETLDCSEILICLLGKADVPRKRRKTMTLCEKPKTNLEVLLEAVGMTPEDYQELQSGKQCEVSLLEAYREKVILIGFIGWRIHTPDWDCVVLNDYDMRQVISRSVFFFNLMIQ